jgi:hypothetical protein
VENCGKRTRLLMPYLTAFDFRTLGLHPSEVLVLETLQNINLRAEEHLAFAMQVPELGLALDLESRADDEDRQFKHIHQMCLMHATHLQKANQIRTTYLVDSYLWAVSRLNPLAMFGAARAILELHTMARYVQDQLKTAAEGPSADWRARGLRYFPVIIRARFGTADPTVQDRMRKAHVPTELVQPIPLKAARAFLANEIDWIKSHYATLCDFVHPNALSQRTTAPYAGEGDIAVSGAGRASMVLDISVPMIQYDFPMPEVGRAAVRLTASRALASVEGIVAATNDFLQTPFTREELLSRTGSPIGFVSLTPQRLRSAAAGRNDPCPCGSGRKFKKCHEAPRPS